MKKRAKEKDDVENDARQKHEAELHVEQSGRVWTCAILLPDRGEVRAQSTTSAEAALLSAVDLAEVLS